MPSIELQLSGPVYAKWQNFLGTKQAGKLIESGLLGDWVAQAFMTEVDRYLKEGLPQGPQPDARERQDKELSSARRRLTKMQKRVLPMYNENDTQTAPEIARLLGVSLDEARAQVQAWVAEGFLSPNVIRGGEQAYALNRDWQERNLLASRPSLNTPRIEHLPDNLKPGAKKS